MSQQGTLYEVITCRVPMMNGYRALAEKALAGDKCGEFYFASVNTRPAARWGRGGRFYPPPLPDFLHSPKTTADIDAKLSEPYSTFV